MKKSFKIIIILTVVSLSLLGFFGYAFFLNGYKLTPFSSFVYDSDLSSCSIALNDSSTNSYFIPNRYPFEISALNAHPAGLSLSSDNQPQCAADNIDLCNVGDPTIPIHYDCGVNDVCYEWDCETACGSTPDGCTFVDIGAGCFVAGTMVTMSDGSQKPIESVVTGDVLMGGGGVPNEVETLFKIYYKNKLYSLNGSTYFVSDTHPFMTTEGWKSFNPVGSHKENPDLIITKLHIGDVLITDNGLQPLITVSYTYDPQYVYNFRTYGTHTYYADGFLVHNPLDKQAQ